MAFKPLHFFRKRQKLMMAGLVLIAMITFIGVVGSGQGIGGGWAASIKGIFGVVDHAVGTVGGQGYDVSRLHSMAMQRRSAADFVMGVNQYGQEKLLEDLGFTKEDRTSNERFQKKRDELLKKDPGALKDLNAAPASLAIEAIGVFVQRNQIIRQYGIDPTLLGVPDPLQPEPLLEFAYWLKKADEFGIVMSADRIKQDLIRAGHSRIKEQDFITIASSMKPAVASDTVIGWVGDEIRVMMAKTIVMAPDSGTRSMLAAQVTPLDLWKAYVEIKTQLVVGVLPIQVNSKEFLDRVQIPAKNDTAKWQEFVEQKLKPYFEEHKKQTPDPLRDSPGFMIPKKYQVEFLYGDLRIGTDTRKYYEQAAVVEDAKQLLADALSLVPLPLPKVEADRAVHTYNGNKMTGRYRLPDDLQSVMVAGVELADGSRYQLPLPAGPGPFNTGPGVERQAAAQQALDVATALTQGPLSPLAISSAFRPTPRKATRTLPQPQPWELASALVSRGMGLNLGVLDLNPNVLSFLARVDYSEETKPFAEVLPIIRDEMIEDQCRTLLQRDLNQLKKDLDEYGKKVRPEFEKWKRLKTSAEASGKTVEDFDEKNKKPMFVHKEGDKEIKEPVLDYLKRFASVRGMTLAAMKEPRGPYDLIDEKDSTPFGEKLRPVYVRSMAATDRKPDELIRTALIGARGKGIYDATEVQAPPMSQYSKPWEYVLHWKFNETDARVPSFSEAEPQVIEAWKLKEARAFAEEEANTRAKQAKTEDGERTLIDLPSYLPEKYLGRYEETGPLNYRKSNITYVDNPPDDLVDQALSKLKEKGDTLVVANKPKSIYYMLVLKSRDEPRATSKESVAKFDYFVIIPDRTAQIKVDSEEISSWVQRERAREFIKHWEKYFRNRTEYDEKEAARAADALRSYSRNY
jgi:hypothetical protein